MTSAMMKAKETDELHVLGGYRTAAWMKCSSGVLGGSNFWCPVVMWKIYTVERTKSPKIDRHE